MMKMSDIFQDMFNLAISLNPRGEQKAPMNETISVEEHVNGGMTEFLEFGGGANPILVTTGEEEKASHDGLQKSAEGLVIQLEKETTVDGPVTDMNAARGDNKTMKNLVAEEEGLKVRVQGMVAGLKNTSVARATGLTKDQEYSVIGTTRHSLRIQVQGEFMLDKAMAKKTNTKGTTSSSSSSTSLKGPCLVLVIE
jgi:hypothetical protein